MAAAPPGLMNDGWGASGAFHCLTPKVLRQINEWFRGYTRAEKVQCLLAFVHAKAAHLARCGELMQSIIDQAVIDPDQWVQGLARLLNGFPKTGTVQCAQVDNEFVYRLVEVVKLRSTPQWTLPQEAGFITPSPSRAASSTAPAAAEPDFQPVSGRSADEVFKWIEDDVEEQAASFVSGWSAAEETPPRSAQPSRGFRTLPWEDEKLRPAQPQQQQPQPPHQLQQHQLQQRLQQQRQQQQRPLAAAELPEPPSESTPDTQLSNGFRARDVGLQWDVAGLEAAERAVVEPLLPSTGSSPPSAGAATPAVTQTATSVAASAGSPEEEVTPAAAVATVSEAVGRPAPGQATATGERQRGKRAKTKHPGDPA